MTERADDFRRRVYASYVSDFKGSPADLEASLRRHHGLLESLLAPVLAEATPGRTLELGCGPGAFLHWARARGLPGVRGVDVSEEQVALARSLDLEAEGCDALDALRAESSSLDLVVAMDLLEHFRREEALALLEAVHGALRPGGRLFLTTPNGAAWRPGPVVHGDLTHETVFTPRSLRHLLVLAGFGDVEVREVPPPVHGVVSLARRLLWSLMRLAPLLVDRIETGGAGDGILTRVMAVTARRPRGT